MIKRFCLCLKRTAAADCSLHAAAEFFAHFAVYKKFSNSVRRRIKNKRPNTFYKVEYWRIQMLPAYKTCYLFFYLLEFFSNLNKIKEYVKFNSASLFHSALESLSKRFPQTRHTAHPFRFYRFHVCKHNGSDRL